MFFIVPATPTTALHRIRELEMALASSIGLMHKLVERLEEKLGPGLLGDEFQQFANSGPVVREFMARINQFIKDGEAPIATRELREFAGVTWDQAHDVIGCWDSVSAEEKFHSLQLARWVKSVKQGSDA